MQEELKKVIEQDPWKGEMLLYLRNLATKFNYISKQVTKINKRLDKLESVIIDGFRATGTAFNQTKTVCQAIVNEANEIRENLAEYGGVIEGDSFFDNMKVLRVWLDVKVLSELLSKLAVR